MHAHEMMPIQLVWLAASLFPASELGKLSSGRLPTLGSEMEDSACCEICELTDDAPLETEEEDDCTDAFFTRLLALDGALDGTFLEDDGALLCGGALVWGLLVGVPGTEVTTLAGTWFSEPWVTGSVSPWAYIFIIHDAKISVNVNRTGSSFFFRFIWKALHIL